MNDAPARSGSLRPLVVHVLNRLTIGGLENGLVNLINTMDRQRFAHAIICIEYATDFRQRIQRDDVEIRELRKAPGHGLTLYARLYRALRELRPAIVHTRNLGALDAILPAVLARIPHRVHGEHGWHMDDLGGENRRHRQLRRLHRPMISQYVTVSAHLAQYLRTAIGVPAARITQIYNGVDHHRFHPGVARLNHGDLGDEGLFLIGTVGQLRPEKNQSLLVSAFAELLRRRPQLAQKLRLVIVGNGSGRDAIAAQVAAAQLEEQVWLAGARNDVPEILRALDVFVLPSKTEGISNTILEAMSSGLPVVATDVGGNGELIVDGQTGTLVAPDDAVAMAAALETYVTNPALIAGRGAAARERVLQRFSLEAMVESYAHLYDGLLSR